MGEPQEAGYVSIYMRIPAELKDELDTLKKETGLSLRVIVEQLLARGLGRDAKTSVGLRRLEHLLGDKE